MNILILGPSDMMHLRLFVAELAARGHRVHVISKRSDTVPGATFERFEVPSFGVRYPYRWRRRWTSRVREWFRRFDIVNVHYLDDWGIDEQVAREGCLIVKAYGSDVDPPPDAPPIDPCLIEARQRLLRCADMVFTSGWWFRDRVAEFAGTDPGRIEVLPVGVDLDLFRTQDRSPHRGPIVGYFKGFEPVYGPMMMVEAAAHVLRQLPEVHFEFVGAGSLRDACLQHAKELGINHAIRWVGRQPQTAMPRLMSGWDVVALSSRKESFGMSGLEASAMGLPVVAPAVGGLRETVLHGETGLLVEPECAVSLGDGILRLLRRPDLRRAMGNCGRRFVAQTCERRACMNRILSRFEEVGCRARGELHAALPPNGIAGPLDSYCIR